MNQHEWVAGCQQYYRENDLTPGNPDDGEGLGTGKGSPTPVTVHYPDRSVVKYESLPAAAEGTGVARGTIKSRLKYTPQQQRERLGDGFPYLR
jgi:hypothetical protein